MEDDKRPVDLFNERIERRYPTDLGGVALAACLREAVEQQRISPAEAADRLKTYREAYAGKRPDPAA